MRCRTLYTVVSCEAPIRKTAPHTYVVTEDLETRGDAPRSAKARMWGLNSITFSLQGKTAAFQTELGTIRHHDLTRAYPVILIVAHPKTRVLIIAEVTTCTTRYRKGIGWCVLWTCMDNTKTARLVQSERGFA